VWKLSLKKVSTQVVFNPPTRPTAYSQLEHGIILQRPEVPVVNVGTKDKPCYLPPELCNVLEGQVVKKKLHERQTKKMMDCACKPPATNALQIVSEGLRVVGMAGGDNAALVSWPSISLVIRGAF
jgi:eukaryotic translation initiation factor 2C